MADSENKKESFASKLLLAVIVPVAIALLAGGTSPWWWSEIFDKEPDTSEISGEVDTKEEEKPEEPEEPVATEEPVVTEEEKIAAEEQQRLEDRAAYREVPVRTLAGRGFAIQGADPREIAFNILGRISLEEGEEPSDVTRQAFTQYSVVTVTNDGRADDSVGGARHRLEFEKIDDQRWQITWAGMQLKCRRGNNAGKWTTQLCP